MAMPTFLSESLQVLCAFFIDNSFPFSITANIKIHLRCIKMNQVLLCYHRKQNCRFRSNPDSLLTAAIGKAGGRERDFHIPACFLTYGLSKFDLGSN